MIFSSRRFFQKTNKQIRLYYLSTCFRSFLQEIKDTKKTFSKLTDIQQRQKKVWRFHHIFVAFTEYINFNTMDFFNCSSSQVLQLYVIDKKICFLASYNSKIVQIMKVEGHLQLFNGKECNGILPTLLSSSSSWDNFLGNCPVFNN